MSKLGGSNIVPIDGGVLVSTEGSDVLLFKKNDKKISVSIPSGVEVAISEKEISISSADTSLKAYLGLLLANVRNALSGLNKGFSKVLDMKGVGYKSVLIKKGTAHVLVLYLGYSHPIHYELPSEIEVKVDKGTVITLSSHDKCKLGDVTADISKLRKHDVYKGKGVFIRGNFYPSKEMSKK